MDDKDLTPEDTILVNPNDPRLQKAIKKAEDELIISRYWLEPENFWLVKSLCNDLVNLRTVEIQYSDFQQHEEQFYPSKGNMNVKDFSGATSVNWEITKLASDKAYDFPFEIPEDFPRK